MVRRSGVNATRSSVSSLVSPCILLIRAQTSATPRTENSQVNTTGGFFECRKQSELTAAQLKRSEATEIARVTRGVLDT